MSAGTHDKRPYERPRIERGEAIKDVTEGAVIAGTPGGGAVGGGGGKNC